MNASFQKIKWVLGSRVFTMLVVAMLSALLMVMIEIILAAVIQHVIWIMGLGSEPAIPAFFNAFHGSFMIAIGLFLAAGFLRVVVLGSLKASTAVAERSLLARLRQILIGRLLLERDKNLSDPAMLAMTIADHLPYASAAASGLALVFAQGIIGLGLLSAMFFVQPLLSSITLVMIFVLAVISHTSAKRVSEDAKALSAPRLALFSGLQRVTRNAFFVRIMNADKIEYQRLSKLNQDHVKIEIHNILLNCIVQCLVPAAGVLMVGALFIGQHVAALMPASSVLTFVYLSMRMVQVLVEVSASLGQWSTVAPAFYYTLDLLNSTSVEALSRAFRGDRPGLKETDTKAAASPPSIEFRNVTFDQTNHPVAFHNLSLTIRPGDQLAITGPSGSGKSTLLALMLGQLPISGGSIQIDKQSPAEYLETWSRTVGYVGSEPFLVKGSIRENLIYPGNEPCSDERLWDVLELVHLKKSILQHPERLDYRLGDNGDELSTGEKQRLSLARALLRKPKLLVLDEPSANLDLETEGEIAAILRGLKTHCTTILISHRSGLIPYADQVFEMQNATEPNP